MAQTRPALPLPPEPENLVCISNLPHDADEKELLEICYIVGAASAVHILRKHGCAFCKYADESEVLLACEDLNRTEYRGRCLRFEPAVNCGKPKVFPDGPVAGTPHKRPQFPSENQAVQKSVLCNSRGQKRSRSRRRGKRDGRHMAAALGNVLPVGRQRGGQASAKGSAALEITNLSSEVTEEDLCEVFSSILGFVSLRLEKEETCGILGGRGICEFHDASLAQEALDMMQGIDICGLEMAVALLDRVPARPKPEPVKVLKFRCTQCDERFAKWPPCRTHLIEQHPEIVPEDKWKLHPDDFRVPE